MSRHVAQMRMCFCSKVLTRFDPLQSRSGRPWTSHANAMSLVLLDEDVKDVPQPHACGKCGYAD